VGVCVQVALATRRCGAPTIVFAWHDLLVSMTCRARAAAHDHVRAGISPFREGVSARISHGLSLDER
jgi:hypothetical protein